MSRPPLADTRDQLEQECAELWRRLRAGLGSTAVDQEAFGKMAQRLSRQLVKLKAVHDQIAEQGSGRPGHIA